MKFRYKPRPVGPTHRLYEQQPKSPTSTAIGLRAYWIGRAVALWTVNILVKAQEIKRHQRQEDGSS